jgi:peptide-methionine (S)-S-oxide reductase
MKKPLILAALAASGLFFWQVPLAAEKATLLPAPAREAAEPAKRAVAVFAGGCFWGMEAVFEQVKGVSGVVSGYAGGTAATANYGAVSAETTKHAEAIRITYDPKVVSYGTLLRIFMSAAHDPTQFNRQGPDVGSSYRSAIFPQSPAQRQAAGAYILQLSGGKYFPERIVTMIENGAFYPAEDYHQDFMKKNPRHPYIVRWDVPKVAGFRAMYPKLVK